MTQKEMLNQLLNGVNAINQRLDSIETRVNKLEGSKPKSGKGNSVAVNNSNKGTKKSLKDFEAKKGADGQYIWKSYKAQRLAYCYYVATKGVAKSSNECYQKGIAFDTIKADFEKAKAEYSKKFVYIKKADR